MKQDSRIDLRISKTLKEKFFKWILKQQKTNTRITASNWLISKIEQAVNDKD